MSGVIEEETPEMARRRVEVEAKLQAMNEQRLEVVAKRQQELDKERDPTQDVDLFLKSFGGKRSQVEEALESAAQIPKENLQTELDKLSAVVVEMQNLLNSSTIYLPNFEIRQGSDTIKKLEASIKETKDKFMGKKKFSFSSKLQKKTVANSASKAAHSQGEAGPEKSRDYEDPNRTISDKSGETMVRGSESLKGGDFYLRDLDSCTVYLNGPVTALRMYNLKNTKVFAGPSSGSSHIEKCENCVLVLAAHQMRIHHTTKTDFYVKVRSGPIIEHCSEVRFAPYAYTYEEIEGHVRDSDLENGTDGKWALVEDFRWLRSTQSPNWSVLPEGERMQCQTPP